MCKDSGVMYSPDDQGEYTSLDEAQSPSALQLVEGVCPPPPQTEGHQTLMDIPLQVRLQATGIGTGATEGVGRGNGWHP